MSATNVSQKHHEQQCVRNTVSSFTWAFSIALRISTARDFRVISARTWARARTKRKAPAKRSQHANATCRNIVGRNTLRAFGHRVATCCDMLGVVGSSLKLVKFEPTTPNMSQQGGQTHATCCAQQCCDMLHCHVAIVWPGLKRSPSN